MEKHFSYLINVEFIVKISTNFSQQIGVAPYSKEIEINMAKWEKNMREVK